MTGQVAAVAPCCIEEAALEALTVPVLAYGDGSVLFANAAAQSVLAAGPDDLHEMPIEMLVPDDGLAAAREQYGLLENGVPMRGLRMRGRRLDGSDFRGMLDGDLLHYGNGDQAVLVTYREVDDNTFVHFQPSGLSPNGADHPASCIHRAAFESLPIPVAVQDKERFVRANRQARLMFRSHGSMEGVPIDAVMDPSFASTAADRRHLVIDYMTPFTDGSAKLHALDGTTLYLLSDGAPAQFDGKTFIVFSARNVTEV
jgi:PAS domain-containing protein